MNPKVIVIDGKTYHSVEEMPPEIRQKYEQAIRSLGDANKNRVPDAFETTNIFADKDKDGVPDVVENITSGQAVVNSMKIIVDGKEFDGLANLPPEARARYEEAMGQLDANRNGIPDFVEGMINTANQNMMSVSSASAEAQARSTPFDTPALASGASVAQGRTLPVNPTINPDTSSGWMLVLGGLFIFLLCVAGAGALWYFFLR